MEKKHLDVVVVGSGPGGYVAALKAAAAGLRTAIVEKDPRFGGTCLHVGCIPSKVFLHTAGLMESIRNAQAHGVSAPAPSLEWTRLLRRNRRVISKLAGGVKLLLSRAGVTTANGFARLDGPGRVRISGGEDDGRVLGTANVIVATGSEARSLPFVAVDEERILTNAGMFEMPDRPARLGIIGAGAVGAEFASMFRAFGSEVFLYEALPRVLPLEDEEISTIVERAFRKRGIRVATGATVEAVEPGETGVVVRRRRPGEESGTDIVDRLLIAVGRAPRTSGIGLESVGVELGPGGTIPVDGHCRTSAPGVFAIGDVTGSAQLAHVASAEADAAVARIAGRERAPLRRDRMPAATYCFPEVASVGLTEAAAAGSDEASGGLAVGKFPFSANSKASILGEPEGMVKVVAERRYGEVLGVHIVGPHATDLIAEAVVALEHEATLESLAGAVHPHPTLSEAVAEAALAALGAPLHA